MPTAIFQPSFSSGVLSPDLHSRFDISRYSTGLSVAENVFIHVHGGASNRAGTQFICEVPNHDMNYKLIPFKRSEAENMVLVFGNSKMRVIFDGNLILDGGEVYELTIPYENNEVEYIDYAQSIDVLFNAHPNHHPKKISRLANNNWTIEDINTNPTLPITQITSVTAHNGGSDTYRYKISSVFDGSEGLPSDVSSVENAQNLDIQGAKNTITFTSEEGYSYNIYKERSGVFGYIGFNDTGTFIDDNIDADLTKTPVEQTDVFSGENNFPSVVNLFQQRLIFGATNLEPETIFPSRIGDYENFTKKNIITADDAFEKSMTGDGVAQVKYMLSLRELLVFTSSGEFAVTSPDGTLSADNVVEKQFGYSGSTNVKPLVLDDTALFVDRTGRTIRDLRYAFEQDGYAGNDLTVFSPHFFEFTQVKTWAYAKNPFSIVWVVLKNGKLLSFTYKREHQISAWCEHDLGGDVEDVAVIPEGDKDSVYLLIRREVEGVSNRYIERMACRSFEDVTDYWFVDSGIKYEGEPTKVITGLDHLEGKQVTALADGNVVSGLIVTNGHVELQWAASKVIIGLPFTSKIQTLPISVNLDGVGSSRGRPVSINQVNIQLKDTRGIKSGADQDKLNEFIQTKQDLSRQIPVKTGMISVVLHPNLNKDGTVIVQQDYPLPMSVLGISPEYTIGR